MSIHAITPNVYSGRETSATSPVRQNERDVESGPAATIDLSSLAQTKQPPIQSITSFLGGLRGLHYGAPLPTTQGISVKA